MATWTYGDDYDPVDAEPIVCRWLRTPYPWIVVAGAPQQLVDTRKVAYTRFTGHDVGSMIVIYGPPKIIAKLEANKCRQLYRPLGSNMEGGIISLGAYNPWSGGLTANGMVSPHQSSNI